MRTKISSLTIIFFVALIFLSCSKLSSRDKYKNRISDTIRSAFRYSLNGNCNKALSILYSIQENEDILRIPSYHYSTLEDIRDRCKLSNEFVNSDFKVLDGGNIIIKVIPYPLDTSYIDDRTHLFKEISRKDINILKKDKSEFETLEAYEHNIESKLLNGYYIDMKYKGLTYDAEQQGFGIDLSTTHISPKNFKLIAEFSKYSSFSRDVPIEGAIIKFKNGGRPINFNINKIYMSYINRYGPYNYAISFILDEQIKNRNYADSNYFSANDNLTSTTSHETIIFPFALNGLDKYTQVEGNYNFKYNNRNRSKFYLYVPPKIAKSLKSDGVTVRVYFSFDFDVFNIYIHNYGKSGHGPKHIGARLQAVSIYSTKDMILLSKISYD